MLVACALLGTLPFNSSAATFLDWRAKTAQVSADIKSEKLGPVLEQIAAATGWQIFVEPNTTRKVSTKFHNLPPGDALKLLLGDLNFALVPQTNAPSRLYVFRTSQRNATQFVAPSKRADSAAGKPIPNELILRLKKGANIDEIARLLGAKVVGRIDSMNAYRLRFDDASAADAAREQLASRSDVASVDDNYAMEPPLNPREVASTTVPPPRLSLNPPPDSGRIIVGLVDTAVQPLGNNLDQFLLKQVSVAGDSQLDPNAPMHGTSMAETILRGLEAGTQGKTSVQILPVDVYGGNAATTTFDVALGVTEAVNGGARIINLSLGSDGDSSFLRELLVEVSQKNIIIFGAKGNTPVTTPFFPAADPGVIAVTAVDNGQLAPYANRADIPAVGAPGTSIVYFNGQPYYVVGTSVSTAYASAIAGAYMDLTHKSAADTQNYIQNRLAIKPAGQ